MKLPFTSLVAGTVLLSASVTLSAQTQAPLQKSDAITIAVNYAKVQPYEDKKVAVSDFVVNTIKDLNGIDRSYEVSLFDDAKQAVGYINIPTRQGFDVVSNYAFNGTAKSAKLRQQFTKQIELVELATGNKAFFIGYEYGAIGVAIKLDERSLSPSIQGYNVIGDYAIFSNFQQSQLQGLTKAIKQQLTVTTNSPNRSETNNNPRLQEERELRTKLLHGDTDLEQGQSTTRLLSLPKSSKKLITGNAVGGQPLHEGTTDYSGYNQYQIYKKTDNSVCLTGCTPTAYVILFDYWDRKKFPNLIGNSVDRDKTLIKKGVEYGEGDNKHYTNLERWTEKHMDEDAFNALLTIRKYLKTECDALTRPRNVTKAELYIKDRGYDGNITRTSGLFGNQRSFDKLKAEIDAGRPVIMGMTMDGTWSRGHTVMAYGYRDAPDTQYDKIYVVMGMGMSEGSAVKRNFQVSTSAVKITERPTAEATPVNPPLTTWQKIQAWFQGLKR